MRPEQQRLTPVERSNLVAYLDGELNEHESQVISTKLTQSPTARREAEVLEKTWDLLQHLPRPRASEALSQRTLSEVKRLAERGGHLDTAVKHATRRAVQTLLWVCGSCLASGLGYVATQYLWPNPTSRLARDLPLAEHLDEYRAVGTYDFLKELANSPEFGTDRDN